jgi:hypothetical protein
MKLSGDVWDKVWEQLHKLETAVGEAEDWYSAPPLKDLRSDEYVKKSGKKKKKR